MLLAFVVLGLVSSVPSQEIGWEECLGPILYRVGRKTKLDQSVPENDRSVLRSGSTNHA